MLTEPARRVALVAGLMPFLETSRSEARQERIRALAAHGNRLALVAAALGRLPRAALRVMVRLSDRSMDGASVAATAALVRGDVARAAFFMGRSEFHDLAPPSQGWDDLRHFAATGRCAPPCVHACCSTHVLRLKRGCFVGRPCWAQEAIPGGHKHTTTAHEPSCHRTASNKTRRSGTPSASMRGRRR